MSDELFEYKECREIFRSDNAEYEYNRLEKLISQRGYAGDVYEVLLQDNNKESFERILWFEKIKKEDDSYKVALSMEVFENYNFHTTLLESNGLLNFTRYSKDTWVHKYVQFRSEVFFDRLNDCFIETTKNCQQTLPLVNWTELTDVSAIRMSQIGLDLCYILWGE